MRISQRAQRVDPFYVMELAKAAQAMAEQAVDPGMAQRLAESFFGTADWMRSISAVPPLRGYVLTGARGEPAQIGLVSAGDPPGARTATSTPWPLPN
mgnify:CR=1 FL=1